MSLLRPWGGETERKRNRLTTSDSTPKEAVAFEACSPGSLLSPAKQAASFKMWGHTGLGPFLPTFFCWFIFICSTPQPRLSSHSKFPEDISLMNPKRLQSAPFIGLFNIYVYHVLFYLHNASKEGLEVAQVRATFIRTEMCAEGKDYKRYQTQRLWPKMFQARANPASPPSHPRCPDTPDKNRCTFRLYEVPRTGKFIKTESRIEVTRG